MATVYFITNTEGSDIFSIQPNGVDITNSDLRLYGMGATLWGEGVDENLLRLSENFAIAQKDAFDPDFTGALEPKSSASYRSSGTGLGPFVGQGNGVNNPREGQLWFNKTDGILYVWDGVNWNPPAAGAGYLLANGSTPMTGDLDMGGFSIVNLNLTPPTNPDDVATKGYVDSEIAALDSSDIANISTVAGATVTVALNQIGTDISSLVAADYLEKAGGTMTGTLVLNADPVGPLEAATKQYVDNNFIATGLSAVKTAGDIIFNDNVAAQFGTGGDVRMFVAGVEMYTDLNTGGRWFLRDGNSGSATRFTFDIDTGDFTATGDVTGFSDRRLKDKITPITNALDRVSQINGVTFNRIDLNDTETRHTGVIAQEVQAVLPEAVTADDNGTLSVAYGNMVGLLVEAIKELKAEIEELKNAK